MIQSDESRYEAACFFLMNEEGKVLAVSRKDDPNDFGLPGGKIEPGETSIEAAIRELREETGLFVYADEVRFVYEREDNGKFAACYTTDINNLHGQISLTETGKVEWVDPVVITQGSFGEYNKGLLTRLGIPF